MWRVALPLLLTAVAVFSIVDIATIDRARVKHIPKTLWIILVIISSIIGTILWFTIGRARKGEIAHPTRRAPIGPDDDPTFFDGVAQQQLSREQQERIRDLERQLAELDEDVSDGERPGDEPKTGP